MNERYIYQFFRASILLKGAHAIIECAVGIALAVVSTASIVEIVNSLTQEELVDDPNDFVATRLLAWAQNFSMQTQHFYALYLLSHGVVKILLVGGLLKRKLWSYPASLVVMGAFIIYQLYRYCYTHSPGLLVISIFDIIVVALIWHEYRLARHHLSRI